MIMKSFNKNIGNYGESLACRYLAEKYHQILDVNFKSRNGEIDIISLSDDILVFTEVKTRYSTSFGIALEAVDNNKKRRIISSAKYYIYINNLYNINVRFDICEVILNYKNDNYFINYYLDAFRL